MILGASHRSSTYRIRSAHSLEAFHGRHHPELNIYVKAKYVYHLNRRALLVYLVY